MTRRFIFADTSVLLNFICAGEQHLLLKLVGNDKLHVPAAVNNEMHRKLKDTRFQCGSRTWSSLIAHGHVHVLDDDMDRLFKHIRLFAGPRFSIQGGMAKNLGEYTAIAHCLALLEEDPSVRTAIIIDDEEAQELVHKRQAATVFTTEAVLLRCVHLGVLTDRGQSRKVWDKLSKFDVLAPFETTRLNDRTVYRARKKIK
ncbi:hypothetical protein I6J72_02030 [Corynebacterium sp. FDAARGOS 1242]|uniref:hypothetical protein n=1 Tax=Corynebacterium sp. FDAARGOS 1242 TaxID=2778078 RepID=UPI00194E5C8B|nr:hypothetical protein [Corynebacterium sp. FDAARGOS 1242]QRP98362.1 hypothetical protein I6J72_02030 [Corynebacterium sp. FDAARGOS 1242]